MRSAKILLTVLSVIICGLAVLAGLKMVQSQNDIEIIDAGRQSTQEFFNAAVNTVAWENSSAPAENTVAAKKTDINALFEYTANSGIAFKSYCKSWNEDKLRELSNEFNKNKFGKEVDSVKEIIIHEGTQIQSVAGMQEEKEGVISLGLRHAALPRGLTLNFSTQNTSIHLYSGEVNSTVEKMAKTLSHEYGHHFTNYYIFLGLTPSEIELSEYYKLRGLKNTDTYTEIYNYTDYLENHMWYVREIAAEDYVSLLGSPTAFQVFPYYDVMDNLDASISKTEVDNNFDRINEAVNVIPQENMNIPYALENQKLSEYFAGFLGEKPKSDEGMNEEKIKLAIKKKVNSQELMSGSKSYISYEITWNTPFAEQNASYTLVCYDEKGSISAPVKTTYTGEKGIAYIGNVAKTGGEFVYNMDDKLNRGTKIFRVVAVSEKGTVAVSEPLTYKF